MTVAGLHAAGERQSAGWARRVTPLAAFFAMVGIFLGGVPAQAQDASSAVASAQAEQVAAQNEVDTATSSSTAAQDALAGAAAKAEKANKRAAAATSQLQAVESELMSERQAALEKVKAEQDDYNDDKNAYNREHGTGYGIAAAALILGLIAFFWRRFRTLSPMGWLAERGWLAATGISIGLALLLFGAGGALVEADSVALAALGGCLIMLGIGLPTAFLLARHSVRVEREVGQPLIRREAFPRWVTIAIAALCLLFVVVGVAGGGGGDRPTPPVIDASTKQLAEEAEGDPLDPPTDELTAARATSEPLTAKASQLETMRQEAEQAANKAEQQLNEAQNRLAQAQSAVSRASRRLSRQQALAAPPSSSSGSSGGSSGGGSYTSCDTAPSNISVPPGSPLDADGDGVGCES